MGARCDGRLAETRRLVDVLRAGGHTSAAAMALWNDLNLALHNAFSTASLVSNVHPDEAVRTRAERAEQDAHRLLTEIGLDRELYDVLAAVDPADLDEGGRRVHALALRDFKRAGVDQARRRTRRGCGSSPSGRPRWRQEFSKNIRDDVRSVRVDAAALDGLPADFVEAHAPGDDGLVEITTAYPDYVPFMTFCRDREARAALVRRVPQPRLPRRTTPLLHELLGAAPRARPAARLRRLAVLRRRGQDDRQGVGDPGVHRADHRGLRRGRPPRRRRAAAPAPAGPPRGRRRSPPSTGCTTPRCCAGRPSTSTPSRCGRTSTSPGSGRGCSP